MVVTRRAKHKAVLMIWLALFLLLGFGVWSFQAGELMLLLFLVITVLAYGLYAFTARCRECRMPLLLRPARMLGMDIYLWSLVTPERCRHCGKPIP
jgi:hypothetical protein